ncbi:TNF receptor-associated factor 3 isoform 1 [Oopsacas minuta]|uniref:TNF receptor-associated factor 3 isoform 1 n=1 Tax=Oopsacas minuta TaxID=111878 RepID=A0AAV7KA80_9METZ|nr:TNF receptor-associated factor 3 isoform 1 [Oopsacas minuta]
MDSLFEAPDDLDPKLYVQCENRGVKLWGTFGEEYILEYRGYKDSYLVKELSEMERQFIVCPTCNGIMRDAIASEGETTCMLCSQNQKNPNPVNQVRNSVAKLGIKCPLLKDCAWVGKLLDAEKHLKECGNFRLWCQLECGAVIKRIKIQYKDLLAHSEMCFASPIECGCGNKCRRDMLGSHVDKECPLGQVRCPFGKYGCSVGVMARKDLLTHKKEFCVEHQDMILAKLDEREAMKTPQSSGKENLKFSFLDRSTSESKDSDAQRILELEKQQIKLVKDNHDIKVELSLLKAEMRIKKDLEGVEWKIELDQLTFARELTSPVFYICNYKFQCSMKVGVPHEFLITRLSGVPKGSDKDETYITEIRLIIGNNEFDSSSYFQEIWPDLKAVVGKNSNSLFTVPQNIFTKHAQANNTVIMFIYFDLKNHIK